MKTRTLFRPVGQRGLDLIRESGFRTFPPRWSHQPIFYPVLNYEYAVQIARDWNTKDPGSGFTGYVASFDVEARYLEQFPVHTVGGRVHREYWIPAEELAEFNQHVVGLIRVLDHFS